MLRKIVLYGTPIIVVLSWMLALSQLVVQERPEPPSNACFADGCDCRPNCFCAECECGQ